MSREIFTSQDVVELVGVTPVHLNALVHRKLYRIKPSISGPGKRFRVFDEDDLFGIAFVWILFESGLRTEEIRSILTSLVGNRTADAEYTAKAWFEIPGEYLIVIRDPGNANHESRLHVGRAHQYEIADIIVGSPRSSVLAIPIGPRFAEIQERIATKFGE
jgi:DNA-binding transcriptional MerR regulator